MCCSYEIFAFVKSGSIVCTKCAILSEEFAMVNFLMSEAFHSHYHAKRVEACTSPEANDKHSHSISLHVLLSINCTLQRSSTKT